MAIRVPATPESRRAASRHAAAVRDHGDDSTEAATARREWQAERWIALFVALAAEAVPTFTPEQRERLAIALAHIQILREALTP